MLTQSPGCWLDKSKGDISEYFLTPEDIKSIRMTRVVSNIVNKILEWDWQDVDDFKGKIVQMQRLTFKITRLAIRKKWEEDGFDWYIKDLLWFAEKLKKDLWRKATQECFCWHLLAWWTPTIQDIKCFDFEWENSIMNFLWKQLEYLLSLDNFKG